MLRPVERFAVNLSLPFQRSPRVPGGAALQSWTVLATAALGALVGLLLPIA